MIVSDLDHAAQQAAMTPGLSKAIGFLNRRDIRNLPDGKVEIDGERVFAIVQRYETVSGTTPKFEAHRKYVDVQFILSGEEVIGWAPVEDLEISEAYDPEKDICFGAVPKGMWTPVHLRAGQLAILYPEDGHAPKQSAGVPSLVMKIVVKVAV